MDMAIESLTFCLPGSIYELWFQGLEACPEDGMRWKMNQAYMEETLGVPQCDPPQVMAF